jgi:glutamyl-tRNA synthetase
MPFSDAFRDFVRSAGPASRLRFAPTPSGYLHRGNALNFILNWLVARLKGGRILLRIDDLDAERKRPEYVADVFESLHWLGLDWDEGPGSGSSSGSGSGQGGDRVRDRVGEMVAEFEEKWSQHRRLPLYINLLERLRETGLLFACRKSRRDLEPFAGLYPPEFRDQGLSLDAPDVAWRIATPPGFPMPDFVVRRRDGIPAYQVASLADDLHFGVTHVVRGEDLAASTAAQRFLAEQIDAQDFLAIRFLHHPLLTDANGQKLSKSAGADSLKNLREGGGVPEQVFNLLQGWPGFPAAVSAADLLDKMRGAAY